MNESLLAQVQRGCLWLSRYNGDIFKEDGGFELVVILGEFELKQLKDEISETFQFIKDPKYSDEMRIAGFRIIPTDLPSFIGYGYLKITHYVPPSM